MTGQELVKLAESNVFRPTVMDTIINEFTPASNAFFLTDKFLPFKLVDNSVLIDMISNGAFGRTHPVNLGAEHRRIPTLGFSYKQHTAGHWREAVMFDEATLQEAVDPAAPLQKAGEQLAVGALNLLDVRLNNLIEYVTSKIVIEGTYSEARHGVAYTYNPNIPAKHYKNP
jgi:hypothetical protein